MGSEVTSFSLSRSLSAPARNLFHFYPPPPLSLSFSLFAAQALLLGGFEAKGRAGQDCGSFALADKYPETAPTKLFFQAKIEFLENPILSTTKITFRAAKIEEKKQLLTLL